MSDRNHATSSSGRSCPRSRTPRSTRTSTRSSSRRDANKIEIKNAVESIFGVRVTNVNTLNRKGKRKKNRRTGTWGSRAATKRAVVSLAAGDRIEIFGS